MRIQLFQPQAIYELGGRKNQEDCIYPLKGEATDQNRVFVVCDGMGGMDKGEVASAAVCSALSKVCESLYDADKPFTDADFNQALQQAYDALDAADVNHEATMGTTMTFICFHRGGCLVAHIGDSRIYHLRPEMGYPAGVRFRSRDHSLVQQLYDLGEISYHGMGTSPRKNVILKAMQPYQDQRTKATFAHITDVKAGDYFYLCTDGMLEQMDDDELLSIVGNAEKSDEEKVQQLVALTVNNADNHSAYLIKVKDVTAEPGDEAIMVSDEAELRVKNKALNDTRKDEAWSSDEPAAPAQQSTMQPKMQPQQPRQGYVSAQSAYQPKSTISRKSFLTFGIMGALALLMLLLGIGVAVILFFVNKKDVVDEITETRQELQEKIQDMDSEEKIKAIPELINKGVLRYLPIIKERGYFDRKKVGSSQGALDDDDVDGDDDDEPEEGQGSGNIVGNTGPVVNSGNNNGNINVNPAAPTKKPGEL